MLRPMIATLILITSLACSAQNITQVSRYATVANKPLAAQIEPLKVVQQIRFPDSVKSIDQAVKYWLAYSGYHLAPLSKMCTELKIVLNQPLPQVDRNLGPLSIEDGLTVLVGRNIFVLKHNDLLREVNFNLKKGAKHAALS